MNKKKGIRPFFGVIAVVLLLIPITIAMPVQAETYNDSVGTGKVNEIPQSHVISDVPIVGQDSRFYCNIASLTILLNYYGFNVTKNEVFFLMGGGFSLFRAEHRYLKTFASNECAYPPSNHEFLASLLNLSFQQFHTDLTVDEDRVWDQIWNCILQNISSNQPVLISLDAAILSAHQLGLKLPISLWKNIALSINHEVVVVGYNQSNQTICYHDPQYSIFGDEHKGAYLWTTVDVFKTAFQRYYSITADLSHYRIKSFEKPVTISYDMEGIIGQAYQRNMRRLQGDATAYDLFFDSPICENITKYYFGLNVSYRLKNIYGRNLQTQLYSLSVYKRMVRFGIANTFFFALDNFLQRFLERDFSYVFDSLPLPGYKNDYKFIAEEKQIISQLMMDYAYVSPVYENCSKLLQHESQLWFRMADYHRILLNKGIFTTIPRAVYIFNKISSILEEIIQIQQEILSLSNSG
ncbi:MAG: C39 family peptidase [Thermoplasmatota archaeon]